jgi:titin
LIEGNYIGTNLGGTAPLPNLQYGVSLTKVGGNTIGGTATGAGNLISGNAIAGVYLTGNAATGTAGNTVQGNLIGLTASGTAILGNENQGVLIDNSAMNLIGGTVSGARNVIAGNGYAEVRIQNAGANGNTVQGNYLGTDRTGLKGLANSTYGVRIAGGSKNLIGGTTAAAANVISGNLLDGVCIDNGATTGVASQNVVEGNLIGLQANGTGPLPNGDCGVLVAATANSNMILGNTIAYNGLAGVSIGQAGVESGSGSYSNSILGNSIFGNGALGIDLGGTGVVVANHSPPSTTGPNSYENYPVLTAATSSGTTTTIKGSLASFASGKFRLEFFVNTTGDPSGHGQGQKYLGVLNVTTNAAGNCTFSVTFPVATPANQVISATSTGGKGNTSEFSANVSVSTTPLALHVPDDDSGPRALPAAPAAVVSSTSNGPSMPAPSSTSMPSSIPGSGSPMSAADQLFADFILLNEMRNANQPASSMVPALWQNVDALVLQRLDLLLSMEAGAMGVTKDTLMRELFFARLSAPNGV